jgi:hypothetical protein
MQLSLTLREVAAKILGKMDLSFLGRDATPPTTAQVDMQINSLQLQTYYCVTIWRSRG